MSTRIVLSRHSRRTVVGALAASAGLPLLGARAFAQATPDATPVTGTRTVTHALGVTEVPIEPRAVVALGDEWMLADLLDFSVRPVGSSSTYGDRFIGLSEEETAGIVPLATYEPDLELVSSLAPDLIVVPESSFDFIDGLMGLLTAITPAVVAIPDLAPWRDGYRTLAAVFGREMVAEERIAALEARQVEAAATSAWADLTVTVATVYPGDPSVTLWLLPTIAQTEILTGLGATLVPDQADYDVDDNGRASISLEQVNQITGDVLIMLQTSDSPDEEENLTEVTSSPLWRAVPAVSSGRVFISERVGYPGAVRGRERLIDEFLALPLGPA